MRIGPAYDEGYEGTGISGTVSPEELEKMIKTDVNRAIIDTQITIFETAQIALISALKQVFSPAPVETGSVAVNALDISIVLNRLHELLVNDDYETIDFVSENRDLLSVAIGIDVFAQVEFAIKHFDFESALQRLNH